ncbi:hypothetical protein V8E55_002373 [Tylopilus felleus]
MFPTVAHVRSHRDSPLLLLTSSLRYLARQYTRGVGVTPYTSSSNYCQSFARFRYFFFLGLVCIWSQSRFLVSSLGWLVVYLHQFQYCFPFGSFGIGISIVSVRKFTTKLSDDPCGLVIHSTTFAHPFKQTTLQTSSP